MSRETSFIPNEYYHIYNRGVNKMVIFNDSLDYDRFQSLLFFVNSKRTGKLSDLSKSSHPVWEFERGETLVDIGAYTLMPNHFHLLIRSKSKEDVALFLQRLQMSYTKYFNIKNERSGVLFQGKSKANHIIGDNYLKYIFSYIHLNIIKLIQKDWREASIKDIDKAIEYLSKYKYSSYLDFDEEERNEEKILDKSAFPEYFPTSELFKKEIFEWLNYKTNEEIES